MSLTKMDTKQAADESRTGLHDVTFVNFNRNLELRRGLDGIYRSVSREHLHRYLSEFEFRHNYRELTDGERTNKAIRCADGKLLTYCEVVNGSNRLTNSCTSDRIRTCMDYLRSGKVKVRRLPRPLCIPISPRSRRELNVWGRGFEPPQTTVFGVALLLGRPWG